MFSAGKPKELEKKMEYIINNYEEAKQTAKEGQKFIVTINSELSANQAFDMYKEIIRQEKLR